jgi:hypothetical protein
MAKRNTNIPIRFDKFDVKNVVITEPEDNDMVKTQKLSYPRYKNGDNLGQLLIKTPVMNIFSGGIPSIGEYFKDDKARAKGFKIPFDVNNSESKQFLDSMKELQEWMASPDFQTNVLGTTKNIECQTIISEPMIDEDDESKNNRPCTMKVRIALDYNTDKVLTQLFVKNEEGKRVATEVDTLDDLCKFVRYKSNVRLIIQANKFYIMKNPDPKTKKKLYGLTFKVMQIEVDAPSATSMNFDKTVDNFDSDDEDDKPSTSRIESTISTIDLDDGIEEEEEVPKSKSKGKTKKDKHADA